MDLNLDARQRHFSLSPLVVKGWLGVVQRIDPFDQNCWLLARPEYPEYWKEDGYNFASRVLSYTWVHV